VVIPTGDSAKREKAQVLGSDEITDLAVLEIDDKYVTAVAQFGNSDAIKAGEPAIAIGNPLGLNFSQSVTVGVISSPKRTIDVNEYMATDVIQTDAAINPGNSGGALVNAAGQVIGINTLKIADKGVEGLGFAIPANNARPIIENLIKHGRVPRPYIGIQMINLYDLPQANLDLLNIPPNIESGMVIQSVEANSPAAKAGLKAKDIIVAINGKNVKTDMDLRSYLYTKTQIGSTITLTFYRDGKKRTAKIRLSEAPANQS
jgi:serine protease Do